MRFSALAIVGALVGARFAYAGACWKAETCRDNHFETKQNMVSFAVNFCAGTLSQPSAYERAGVASAFSIGSWGGNITSCLNAFIGIVNACHGTVNGGTADSGLAHLAVSFGDCEYL
ncbi:hypothetical protein D9615_002046 [Tricholomella constricta]|uniref:Uncharacterized protein n=1 Tax=Tricholomella constricta TaxID=117010 RepID=A0A8H5HPC9_9AGAR|nr:hypothetical protein D9615_002046 [Tricholomella constricta]